MSSPGLLGFSICVANPLGSSGSCFSCSSCLIPAGGPAACCWLPWVGVASLELLVVRPRLLAGLPACSGCPPCPRVFARFGTGSSFPFAGGSLPPLCWGLFQSCRHVWSGCPGFGPLVSPCPLVSFQVWCHQGGESLPLSLFPLVFSVGLLRVVGRCSFGRGWLHVAIRSSWLWASGLVVGCPALPLWGLRLAVDWWFLSGPFMWPCSFWKVLGLGPWGGFSLRVL